MKFWLINISLLLIQASQDSMEEASGRKTPLSLFEAIVRHIETRNICKPVQ